MAARNINGIIFFCQEEGIPPHNSLGELIFETPQTYDASTRIPSRITVERTMPIVISMLMIKGYRIRMYVQLQIYFPQNRRVRAYSTSAR